MTGAEVVAFLLTCPEREATRQLTLERFAATDWGASPRIVVDGRREGRPQERQEQGAAAVLNQAVAEGCELILFLEDDLEFNVHLRHNVDNWAPLSRVGSGEHFFASLYNPTIKSLTTHNNDAYFVADPEAVYGSQAFLLSAATARHILNHWSEIQGMQDIRMSRLAAGVTPIFYHVPSLVQHVSGASVWGGPHHHAPDFDPTWKAPIARIRPSERPPKVLLRLPIVEAMRPLDGWLDDEEAEALVAVTEAVIREGGPDCDCTIVEVGSYCGKSTVVFGLAAVALAPDRALVHAVDPHDGTVTTLAQSTMRLAPTLDMFHSNVADAGVARVVRPVVARSVDVPWDRPIDLLFIDGLHDYDSVSSDFAHFGPWVRPRGLIAFHDYGHHFPGVQRFVDELRASVGYTDVVAVKNLIVLRKAG